MTMRSERADGRMPRVWPRVAVAAVHIQVTMSFSSGSEIPVTTWSQLLGTNGSRKLVPARTPASSPVALTLQ